MPAFRCDRLEYKVCWAHRFDPCLPLYMQISRNGRVTHPSRHHGDATPGSAVRIGTEHIEALRVELGSRPYPSARPAIVDQSRGDREFRLTDPSGNRVRSGRLRRNRSRRARSRWSAPS